MVLYTKKEKGALRAHVWEIWGGFPEEVLLNSEWTSGPHRAHQSVEHSGSHFTPVVLTLSFLDNLIP